MHLQVEREIINHSCLIHPHIVRFRECFLTPKYLGIAMEYAAGGDLYKFVAAKYVLNRPACSTAFVPPQSSEIKIS